MASRANSGESWSLIDNMPTAETDDITFGTPTAFVLYRTPEHWRLSLYCPGGIACGALDDLDPGCEPEVAQVAMNKRAEEVAVHVLEMYLQ